MTNIGFATFDASAQKSLKWIDDLDQIMGRDNRVEAYQALRAVMHTIRDRLTVEEGAELSAQLPMIIRGMYYEGWDPSRLPVELRKREEFLDYVRAKLGDASQVIPADEAVKDVFALFDKHITQGEIEDVRQMLPQDFASFWPEKT